jgi:hypothetical protein
MAVLHRLALPDVVLCYPGVTLCHAVLCCATLAYALPCCAVLCCRGGHGRTGTLVAVMLGRLYGLPSSAALRLTQVGVHTRTCK